MKEITAKPTTIRNIFNQNLEYIIPDFQRRYSWDEDLCDQLWSDIIDFYDEKKSTNDEKNTYFLGCMIIYKHMELSNTKCVVDGQQRLTTLSLLIKALFSRNAAYKVLETMLKKTNQKTGELTDDLRVHSEVIEEDMNSLKNIIFDKEPSKDSKFTKNYEHLQKRLDEWNKENPSADDMERLIKIILDDIYMLPIECDSEEDGLRIFETINNRGSQLNDADIFKAKLYTRLGKDSDFIHRWNDIENKIWIFRVYMHILRAQKGDIGKETNLRGYFAGSSILEDGKKTMEAIEKISSIREWKISFPLWHIMDTYPNYYWQFPLYVFLFQNGQVDSDNSYDISTDKKEEFNELLEATVRYFFIQGVVYNSVNTVKDTVFKVCKTIHANKSYIDEYKNNINKSDYDNFSNALYNIEFGSSRYIKGLSLLSTFMNSKQNHDNFLKFIQTKYSMEHILPKKWKSDYYHPWNENMCDEVMDKMGNIMPLESAINIKAGNQFFAHKQEKYKDSKIQDAQDLANANIQEWKKEDFDNRHEEIIKRLHSFFESMKPE